MLKPNKQHIIDLIIKELEKGTATDKICAAMCRKFQFSERSFYNHLKIAKVQHEAKHKKIKAATDAMETELAVKTRKKEILSAIQRKEYLTEIVLGKVKVPYTEVKWNAARKKFELIKFVELANHTARINAIAELNKMEGDYAPTKTALTNSKGEDIVWNEVKTYEAKP